MYEIPMKKTVYRMLQGKKLIMNASTRNMTKQEGDNIKQYYKQVRGEEAPNALITDGVFFNKAFLKVDGETMEYNFDTGKGNMSSDYFTLKQETKKNSIDENQKSPIIQQIHVSFNHSIYGPMTTTLNHFSNPQNKSGMSIKFNKANPITQDLTGLLIREYKCKSMECRKLRKTKKMIGKIGKNKLSSYLR